MIAKKLVLKNFYSHTNTEIVFDKDIYTILGQISKTNKSNGSGKSTIPTGIRYALYGDATESEKNTRSLQVKGDALIYNDADSMEVIFTFEMNEYEKECSFKSFVDPLYVHMSWVGLHVDRDENNVERKMYVIF